MTTITFADVVHQSITFNSDIESQAIVLELIDTPWVQRLRDVNQTANTRLLYMFSEHSRFGHCLGVSYLANSLMDKLALAHPDEVKPYRTAVSAAALLHDIGHLAPGSHIAYKVWFPEGPDAHEEGAVRIIREDPRIQQILKSYGSSLSDLICKILLEDESIPPWTWQIISGGGWNVDRGNWTIVDSVMGGVSYGKYNIPALADSIVITKDHELAIMENRLDAMMHFALSRHAMYRQMYQHRVLLAADAINKAIVKRARDLDGKVSFIDSQMKEALEAKDASALSLETVFRMREEWWRYHVLRWMDDPDPILADLCTRLINRRLFKTVALKSPDETKNFSDAASKILSSLKFDPKYYLHLISTVDMHEGDGKKSMLVLMDDGSIKQLQDAEPLYRAMIKESKGLTRSWLAMPEEGKKGLGRVR